MTGPYRTPAPERPLVICAECAHYRPRPYGAAALCADNPTLIRTSLIDPVTGVDVPEEYEHDKCWQKNMGGKCRAFQPAPILTGWARFVAWWRS